jgi:hypothetical protein
MKVKATALKSTESGAVYPKMTRTEAVQMQKEMAYCTSGMSSAHCFGRSFSPSCGSSQRLDNVGRTRTTRCRVRDGGGGGNAWAGAGNRAREGEGEGAGEGEGEDEGAGEGAGEGGGSRT